MDILIVDDERTLDVFSYLDLGHAEYPSDLSEFNSTSEWNRVFHVREFLQAYHAVMDYPWDIVFLDHDLGERSDGTTADVRDITRDIEKNAFTFEKVLPIGRFIIHSMNPLGRKEMYEALHKFYNVEFARVEDLI